MELKIVDVEKARFSELLIALSVAVDYKGKLDILDKEGLEYNKDYRKYNKDYRKYTKIVEIISNEIDRRIEGK